MYQFFLYVHVESVIVVQTPRQLLHQSIHFDWHVYGLAHYAVVALVTKSAKLHEWQTWRNQRCNDWGNGGSPLGFGGYLKLFDRDKFGILLLSSDFLQALHNMKAVTTSPWNVLSRSSICFDFTGFKSRRNHSPSHTSHS
jgi:hypothetical protein